MDKSSDTYSKREFDTQLSVFELSLSRGISKQRQPRAFLLGGQSGAGKTTLHKICAEKLGNDAIVVNGDEYRKSHPRFDEIQALYGEDAPKHTTAWSGAMTEALIDAFSAEGYNLVIEGTLRTSQVPLATADLLRSRGYAVSLAVMAVKPEISLISCQIRYEMMRLAGTTPRATDPNHHAKIVQEIANNLAVLEQSGRFEAVELYDRSSTRRYPSGDNLTAAEALNAILFGPWTPEEEGHLAHLKARLEDLRGQ